MKLWKKSLIIISIFFMLLCSTIAFMIGTTTGLHLLFKGTNFLVPGLSIQNIHGSWKNLTLGSITYEIPGIKINVEHFHSKLKLNCLLHSLICVDNFVIKDIKIVINNKLITNKKLKKEDNIFNKVIWNAIFFKKSSITFNKITIQHVNIRNDDMIISFRNLAASVHLKDHTITLLPSYIENLLVILPKLTQGFNKKALDLKDSHENFNVQDIHKKLKFIFLKKIIPDYRNIELPINIILQKLLINHIKITNGFNLFIINLFFLKAQMINRNIQITTLFINSSYGNLIANGNINLINNWPIKFILTSKVHFLSFINEKIKLNLTGEIYDNLKIRMILLGPMCAQLDAVLQLSKVGLPLSLVISSSELHWPLSDSVQYQVYNFNYKLTGRVNDYIMSLRTIFKSNIIPLSNIVLNARGNFKQLRLDKLQLISSKSYINLTALVDWNTNINWYSNLNFSNIDLINHYPKWPTKLNGEILACGILDSPNWSFSILKFIVNGNIRNNLMHASGSFIGNSNYFWKIPSINVTFGLNSLIIKGELGNKLNLDINIDALKLNHTLPNLGGMIKSTIKIGGTFNSPQLLAKISANEFRWKKLKIHRLLLKSNLKSSNQITGKLQLYIEKLKQDTSQLNSLIFFANGNEQQHHITLNIKTPNISGLLLLHGQFNRKNRHWYGKIQKTRLNTLIGNWELMQSISIDYLNSIHTIIIKPHCWQNMKSQLCIPKPIKIGPKGYLHIVMNNFDLAMVKSLFNYSITINGMINGDTFIYWNPNSILPIVNLSLTGKNIKVSQDIQDNILLVICETFKINATLHNNNEFNLKWLISIVHNGQLKGNIQVIHDYKENKDYIAGLINVKNISLSMFNTIFNNISNIKGNVNSYLLLKGNLQHPQLFGELGLVNVKFKNKAIPINIIASNFKILFIGVNAIIKGSIKTKEGNIHLNGDANWNQLDNWYIRTTVQSNHMHIVIPSIINMDIFPYILVEINPFILSIKGTFDIPSAHIKIQKVPARVNGVSSDEVMLDKKLQSIKKPKNFIIPINLNLNVHLGNNIEFSAFGLNGKLHGNLKLIQDNTGFGLHGHINISSGRFQAYGQDLIVRKGELQFSGPLYNPYINLEAIRNPSITKNNVTSGLHVVGLINAPKIEVFSNPVMSKQEALSYLLHGKEFSRDSDINVLTSIFISIGIAKSEHIITEIGQRFGISSLVLNIGNSRQVQLNGYLLPNLQVKYDIGIFNSLSTFTIRYRLMPKFYLEIISGLNQAIDLIYQFEF
ncbi:translocation/assembly module TamB domain-containing protein [Pantoea sp. Aalb]|uniref:autotransporter assembly complex protein TamB n=1 Tax=Pantoea sp. Aalb TaxID=2576762 RepID=UPI001321E5A7|nr:translocation/assembly module TamB domain-containing protein [Pantoea sp. Aalb]MXP67689.1 translocation/assembly module TamB [Pantoea sp. Aalb]